MWGFYKKRLRATMDWGNTYASHGWTHKCGCIVDHVFIDTDKDTPVARFETKRRDRMVRVFPCHKHTTKFFRSRWK